VTALDDWAIQPGIWGGQERGTRFLLCGSAMSVMDGLLAGNVRCGAEAPSSWS
jgi:hypothetical protein